MPPTHLLVFDIDGTLLTIDEECAFAEAFGELTGSTPDMDWEKYNSCTDWGVAVEILEDHLGRKPSDEEVRAPLNKFVALMRANIASGLTPPQPTPGVLDFVRRAEAEGYALSLATGCIRTSADAKIDSIGLSSQFPIGGYGDHQFDRASLLRDGIAAAEERHGVAFASERICYFGDRWWDAEGALSLGLHFIGVASTDEARFKLQRAGATRIISDFAELPSPASCFA